MCVSFFISPKSKTDNFFLLRGSLFVRAELAVVHEQEGFLQRERSTPSFLWAIVVVVRSHSNNIVLRSRIATCGHPDFSLADRTTICIYTTSTNMSSANTEFPRLGVNEEGNYLTPDHPQVAAAAMAMALACQEDMRRNEERAIAIGAAAAAKHPAMAREAIAFVDALDDNGDNNNSSTEKRVTGFLLAGTKRGAEPPVEIPRHDPKRLKADDDLVLKDKQDRSEEAARREQRHEGEFRPVNIYNRKTGKLIENLDIAKHDDAFQHNGKTWLCNKFGDRGWVHTWILGGTEVLVIATDSGYAAVVKRVQSGKEYPLAVFLSVLCDNTTLLFKNGETRERVGPLIPFLADQLGKFLEVCEAARLFRVRCKPSTATSELSDAHIMTFVLTIHGQVGPKDLVLLMRRPEFQRDHVFVGCEAPRPPRRGSVAKKAAVDVSLSRSYLCNAPNGKGTMVAESVSAAPRTHWLVRKESGARPDKKGLFPVLYRR